MSWETIRLPFGGKFGPIFRGEFVSVWKDSHLKPDSIPIPSMYMVHLYLHWVDFYGWTTIQLKKIWTKLQNQSPAAILDIAPLRKGEKSSIVQGAFKEHFLGAIVGCYMQGCKGSLYILYTTQSHTFLGKSIKNNYHSFALFDATNMGNDPWYTVSCDCWKTNCSPWNLGLHLESRPISSSFETVTTPPGNVEPRKYLNTPPVGSMGLVYLQSTYTFGPRSIVNVDKYNISYMDPMDLFFNGLTPGCSGNLFQLPLNTTPPWYRARKNVEDKVQHHSLHRWLPDT